MADFTQQNIEAAVLDQVVAGVMQGKRYAFTAIAGGPNSDWRWGLGVAVALEPGYHPINGKSFLKRSEAEEWANGLNDHLGLSSADAGLIVASTMREPIRARD